MKTKQYTEADIDRAFWEASLLTIQGVRQELAAINDEMILAEAEPLTVDQIITSLDRLLLLIQASQL